MIRFGLAAAAGLLMGPDGDKTHPSRAEATAFATRSGDPLCWNTINGQGTSRMVR
jgi:hypothetical protein